ncbi:hypothetical protein BDF20DRAFT_892501 [Mycotypha africana]|uniref:uncharacterized protein n=1 Tax=Mycotypha africana TaxID=64632 RepID=UPI0022FFEE2E|nr:uncharacterized protein BDF20DRAFT_892501 [Mycotypha africana]KAI8968959.1 hypothetical protein BDF20DRAFT_892501 [Mycotypha africana]
MRSITIHSVILFSASTLFASFFTVANGKPALEEKKRQFKLTIQKYYEPEQQQQQQVTSFNETDDNFLSFVSFLAKKQKQVQYNHQTGKQNPRKKMKVKITCVE